MKTTYSEIQKFVPRRNGFIPTTGWITHVKAVIAQALLLDIEVDRHKRIDRYIDYFGSGARRTTIGRSGAVWRRSRRRSSNGREEDSA